MLEPLTFESDDVEEIEVVLSGLYSKLSIHAVGARTHARITRRVMAPGVAFDDLDYDFDIGYAGEPQDLVILCEVLDSTIRRVDRRFDETFGPGDVFLISQPGLAYQGTAHSARLRLTLIDPAAFSQVIAADGGDPGRVRLLDHHPVVRRPLDLLRSVSFVRREVMGASEALRSPLVLATATQLLASAMLRAFPSTSVPDDDPAYDNDAHPDTLRRSVAYIEGNADTAVALSDIARAAYVTPRAVQLAFRQHLQTTPMAYLRGVRLQSARHELDQASTGDGVTVTSVSYRWGFSSPSRFARYYRDAFGESPGEALGHQGPCSSDGNPDRASLR